MKISKHRLYKTFGELLYLVAIADGVIDPSEIEALDRILQDHPELEEIKWSFEYEMKNNDSVEFLYKRVIETYADNGPDEVYEYFIKALNQLAAADGNVDESESDLIKKFSSDLIARFAEDLKVKL